MINQYLRIKYNFFKKNHLFHLVKPSYIPILLSITIFSFVSALPYLFFGELSKFRLLLLLSFLILMINFWFLSLTTEYSNDYIRTKAVEDNFLLGMLLFICSEVFLFIGVFWSFFHSSLSPSIFIGAIWPPIGIISLDIFKIPTLNTILLLTSGATINLFYYMLRNFKTRFILVFNRYLYITINNWFILYGSLFFTIFLGSFFMLVQLFEYVNSIFSFSDSIFGSVFYMATGLHGLHVFLGLSIIFYIFIRVCYGDYDLNNSSNILTTCSVWYWHFVDVVWIFLFVFVYFWGA